MRWIKLDNVAFGDHAINTFFLFIHVFWSNARGNDCMMCCDLPIIEGFAFNVYIRSGCPLYIHFLQGSQNPWNIFSLRSRDIVAIASWIRNELPFVELLYSFQYLLRGISPYFIRFDLQRI